MAGPYYFDISQAPYSAIGDGVTDHTTVINQAIKDAGALTTSVNHGTPTNSTVFFPAGIYITKQVVMYPGVTLQGVGSGSYGVPGGNMDAPGWGTSVLKLAANTNDNFILLADGVNYCRFYDMAFDGSKSNNTFNAGSGLANGIHIADGAGGQESQMIMERCFVFNTVGSGIYMGHNRRANKVFQSVVNYSGIDGIQVAGSDNTIQNNILGSNVRANVCLGTNTAVHWGANSAPNSAAVTHVLNNDIYGNTNSPFTQVGIALGLGTWGSIIMENGLDRHQYEGISAYDGTTTVAVGNCFHSNGIAVDNTYGHIGLATNVSSIAISSNSFGPLDGGITNKANYGVYNQTSKGVTAVVGDYGVIFPGSVAGTANAGLHN
jgi:hypothetical protein